MLRNCPWWSPHAYDWIYQGPAVGVLAVNSVFLILIMWVSKQNILSREHHHFFSIHKWFPYIRLGLFLIDFQLI